jgi:hypothetical protein
MLHESLELHCIGAFVFAHFYGLPRTTGDIDYYAAIPSNLNLDEVAGQGSAFHAKHGVWLHRVAVANFSEDYASRLTDMTSGEFKYLKLLVPAAYDCILSKLERNAAKDRDDAEYLFRSHKLNAQLLRDRFTNELRHNLIENVEWHDKTLELWIEIFESQA